MRMVPNSPFVTSSKESSLTIESERIVEKSDISSRIQSENTSTIKTFPKANVQIKGACQLTTGDADRTDEQNADKLLQPIAPTPIAIVCVPDISSVRETEIEVVDKQETMLKFSEEINVKNILGSYPKCEKDHEEDTSLFKKAGPIGRSPPKSKKKPKQIRDLEKTMNCLLSDNEQVKDEKAFAFAQSYFLKVTETLHGKDDATYGEFMKTMNDFGVTIFDAIELYNRVTRIFSKYPNLAEEFLAFLLPEQAMQCGKFMEYIMITKMSSFCRKLELYYSKQPSQLRKIYSSLSSLASNNNATLDDLKNTILPLLRNNSLLVNMFLELMPTEAPHASSLTDYESMDFSTIDIQNPKSEDWFETVEVPPPVEDNMYGGEDCICPCHLPSEGKSRRRSGHCMSCGTKFIQGRVYIHSGSILRPARVSFKEMRNKVIERLSVKNLKTRRKIDKNLVASSSSKKSSSSKGETPISLSGSTKLSPSRTKKVTKGKPGNENQRKSSKTLSPKTSHESQLTNDKIISKPSRKKIKLLTSDSDNPSPSVKTDLVSTKKGVSHSGKVVCKLDTKASAKSGLVFSAEQAETTRRPARSAARNMSFSNESNPKANRRHTEIMTKGEIGDISEAEKNTNDSAKLNSSVLTMIQCNETMQKRLPSECRNEDLKEESSSMKSESKDTLRIASRELKTDSTDVGRSCKDGSLRLSPIYDVSNNMKVEDIENVISSKSEKQVSGALSQPILLCSSTSCDKTFIVHPVDTFSQVVTSKDFPCKTSENKGDDKSNENLDGESSENDSSEDEKNILDSEDFPCSSSSDSEMEKFQFDVEPTGKETTVLQRDANVLITEEVNQPGSLEENISERSVCVPWTRDEDKIILRTFQSISNSEHVFKKICNDLPSRSAQEVQSRFQTLMSFLQKMAGD